jgi:hypothetical protein
MLCGEGGMQAFAVTCELDGGATRPDAECYGPRPAAQQPCVDVDSFYHTTCPEWV